MPTIADRLNDLKGKKTIAAMAKEVGLGTSTLYNYLKGREPGADVIEKVCRALGVNEKWLLIGEGPQWKAEAPSAGQASLDLTDVDFYRRRICELAGELDIHDLVDIFFQAEAKRIRKLLPKGGRPIEE